MKTCLNIRKRNLWTVGLLSLLILAFTGCEKDQSESGPESGETASMIITLKSVPGGSRAVAPTDDAGTEALKAAEDNLKNVTVFVFNVNGTLDKKHAFSTPGLTETITGLIAGPKKVVVVANVPAGINFPTGINYGWFADPANAIDLDSQQPETNGLFMSGEGTVTLAANATTSTSIQISRLVAKVKLGSVTLDPEDGQDLSKFTLNSVMIMRARGSAMMGIPSIAYTPNTFYGGMDGDKSITKNYLREPISIQDHANRYFYVLPSDNDDKCTTLLTLAASYNGITEYFPFRINDKVGTGGATSDGTFIKRNTGYLVNVTIKRLGDGSDNPEVPADPASLVVTVEPQDWETDLIQNVEW